MRKPPRRIWLAVPMLLSTMVYQCHTHADENGHLRLKGSVYGADKNPIEKAIVVVITDKKDQFSSAESKRIGLTDNQGELETDILWSRFKYKPAVGVIAYHPKHGIGIKMLRVKSDGKADFSVTLTKSTPHQLRIKSTDGSAVEGASIKFLSPGPSSFPIAEDTWTELGLEHPRSDPNGILELPLSWPRNLFAIEHPEFAGFIRQNIEFGEKPFDVALEKGVECKVRITCSADPDAVKDTKVVVQLTTDWGSYSRRVEISEDGRGTVRIPNIYSSVRAYHPKYLCHDRYGGQKTNMNFWLYPQGKLTGRVLESNSRTGAAGVPISFISSQKIIATATTDVDGKYEVELGALPAGFRVRTAERTKSVRWQLDSDEAHARVVPLKTTVVDDLYVSKVEAESNSGITLGPDGKPMPGVLISSLGDFTAASNNDGKFKIPQDSMLSFACLHAIHPFKRLSSLSNRRKGDIQIQLSEEGSIVGMVLGSDGKPKGHIPVELSASVNLGGRLISTFRIGACHTSSDGTFRFFGLPTSIDYTVSVRGKIRSSYSAALRKSTDRISLGSSSRRKPIRLTEELEREIELLSEGAPEHPEKLLPFDCDYWIEDHKVSTADLRGKAVLLLFGSSSVPMKALQLLHELYGEHGLRVVCIAQGSDELGYGDQTLEERCRKAEITFPVGHDLGRNTAMKYGMSNVNDFHCLLYDKLGNFRARIPWEDVHSVRNHMIYSHIPSAK